MNKKSQGISAIAAASLVILASMATPARADHGHAAVAPIATFIALNWMFHQQHDYYRHHGHHRKHYRHKRHSHSHGGYQRPKRRHFKH